MSGAPVLIDVFCCVFGDKIYIVFCDDPVLTLQLSGQYMDISQIIALSVHGVQTGCGMLLVLKLCDLSFSLGERCVEMPSVSFKRILPIQKNKKINC